MSDRDEKHDEVERDEDGRPLTPDEVMFKRLHPQSWAKLQAEKHGRYPDTKSRG